MRVINQNDWARKSHFDTFKNIEQPQFSICSKLNVSKLVKSEYNFFNKFLYELKMACNYIPEFKLRISTDEVCEHAELDVNFNLLAKNNCFISKRVSFNKDYNEFEEELIRIKENTPLVGELVIDKSQEKNVIITSYIPWISFSSINEPIFDKNDSLIKIVYGKYSKQLDEYELPLCITAHHALVDGYHMGLFFKEFQRRLNSIG